MRLVCPNCDAEYEVDDAAIPRSGRDVQCSNCGHGWFQVHPEVKAEVEEEAALFGAPADAEPEPEPAWEPEDVLAAEAAADVTPAPVAAVVEPELEPVVAPEPEPPEPEPVAEVPRRSIDESVLAVLREEAEREAAARRGERPRIETQTEMPLDAVPRAPKLEDLSARLEDPVAPPAPEAPRKRALLPEIEEIKSSLHPSADPEEDETSGAASPAAAQGGFRSGLIFALLIAVILLALYVMAPVIAAKVPTLQGVLEVYVNAINALRVALDTRLRALIGWLQHLAGGSAG